jgi:hypothetical protein
MEEHSHLHLVGLIDEIYSSCCHPTFEANSGPGCHPFAATSDVIEPLPTHKIFLFDDISFVTLLHLPNTP